MDTVQSASGLMAFTQAYVVAMLWSSTDDNGDPLDQVADVEDLAPETIERINQDCAAFLAQNGEAINGKYEQAGHDFWLTRNRHGAGFWDGDWPEQDGVKLTEASYTFGECYPYQGDDKKWYLG